MFRTPVHNPVAAIYQFVLVKFSECAVHFLHNVRVESELFARPVAGRAERAKFGLHMLLVFKREGHDFVVEFFARHAEARASFFFQFLFVDNLCFKAGMVGAREPKCFLSAHARETNHYVFNGDKHGVSSVKMTVGIRRGHYYRERGLTRTER